MAERRSNAMDKECKRNIVVVLARRMDLACHGPRDNDNLHQLLICCFFHFRYVC